MANIRSFKELRVWLNAMDPAMLVFEVTQRFPAEERYSLTDQFRRASRSVAANIAEAWRKRRYPAAFVSKLSDAEGEASETQTWIEFARRCGYMKQEKATDLDQRYEQILGQLVTMIEKPDDWVVGARRKKDAGNGRRGDAEISVSPGHRVSVSAVTCFHRSPRQQGK
ncbi:MAG: four helix bundle protein [Tepidisphaerales bacterium]